jgi:hypothetical protein
VSERERVDVRVSASRCPYCHDDVGPEGSCACQSCLARHHDGCWAERGACSACGAVERLVPEPRVPSVDVTFDPDIARALVPGERVLWRARAGPAFKLPTAMHVAIAALVLAFLYAWLREWLRARGPYEWPVVLVLTALYAFLHAAYGAAVRRMTVYAITDRRVMIVRRWPAQRMDTIGLRSLPPVGLSPEGPPGWGTIVLGDARLERIPDAEGALEVLRGAFRRAR